MFYITIKTKIKIYIYTWLWKSFIQQVHIKYYFWEISGLCTNYMLRIKISVIKSMKNSFPTK